MKKLYLIALGATMDRNAVIKKIEKTAGCGPWFYSIPNALCVYSCARATDLLNLLRNPSDVEENLFVTEVPMSNASALIPKAHCDLISANSIVHSYRLDFKGYWVDGKQSEMPRASGIYCVYACAIRPDLKLNLTRLLYVGKAENLGLEHACHERHEDWKRMLQAGESLCFSCAELPVQSLSVCHSALVFWHKPIGNQELKDGFHRSATHVQTNGANAFLTREFTVLRTR